jgi:tol-pal system protein YbgF
MGEQQDYDLALAILREGRYDEANMAFNKFLGSYPNSRLASNASYWLGETYYVTREFDRAETAFRDLVSRYPRSSKIPDSRLKIGYILYEKKDWAGARRELSGVVSDYPGTTAARLADNRLQRMKKEGH